MPYDIDNWGTKVIDDLRIPLGAFFKSPRKDWHPKSKYTDENMLTLEFCDAAEIHGIVSIDILHVIAIRFSGVGSGTSMHEIFEPALKESKGRLVASLVWEGGDSINRLIVDDGYVEWEDIEI